MKMVKEKVGKKRSQREYAVLVGCNKLMRERLCLTVPTAKE